MKKQLSTAILFCFIMISCKKEDVSTPDAIKDKDKTANKLIATSATKLPTYVTLQTVVLNSHSLFAISFGWEYDGNNPRIVGSIATNIINHGSGGTSFGEGYNHNWSQQYATWVNDHSDPNIIHMIVRANDVYTMTTSINGADTIVADVILFVTYNVSTGVYSAALSPGPNGKVWK